MPGQRRHTALRAAIEGVSRAASSMVSGGVHVHAHLPGTGQYETRPGTQYTGGFRRDLRDGSGVQTYAGVLLAPFGCGLVCPSVRLWIYVSLHVLRFCVAGGV